MQFVLQLSGGTGLVGTVRGRRVHEVITAVAADPRHPECSRCLRKLCGAAPPGRQRPPLRPPILACSLSESYGAIKLLTWAGGGT